ncbi:hypothetical protein L3C95_10100 [Chitinophaga filiformis]|uniref:tetratricopeptide repeat-containing sensor histidine kinase n=1 Tax=Chitinophaga filiformis TaxID=104663 RepID=UPI001F209D61|nr:sensor histidine kinase [Chitinophaga filiformis]MCF6402856.1 hypothetical protein [Chitinophaga filiformis]MCF6403226.1 hypothetical protein [Chitinophaga filiformis]
MCLSIRNAQAQYTIKPPVVAASQVPELMAELHAHPSADARLKLLLKLASFYTYKSAKYPADVQKAGMFLRSADSLATILHEQSVRNQVLLVKAAWLGFQEQYNAAEQLAASADDTTHANILIGLIYRYLNRPDQGTLQKKIEQLFAQAASITDSVHHPDSYLLFRRNWAELLMCRHEYDNAERLLNDLLAFGRRRGSKQLQGVYLSLSHINWVLGRYDVALFDALKAVDYVKANGDSASAGAVYQMLAMLFSRTGHRDKAKENYDRALYYLVEFGGDTGSIWTSLESEASDLFKEHKYQEALNYILAQAKVHPPATFQDQQAILARIGDCYLKLKQYSKAEGYFLREFVNAQQRQPGSEEPFHRIAFFYVESGQFKRAQRYLDSAELYLPGMSLQRKAHLYYMRFLADSAMGNYLKAIHYLQLNRTSNDTVFEDNKVREIQHYTVAYETEKKTREIKLLQRSNELHVATRRHAEWIRNISVGAVVLILVAIILFYRQNRSKLRMAATISQKNLQLELLLREKEWLLKEVHHRVKNNLQAVVNLLEIQAEFLEDDALKAIENSQHRVYAMSLIHQKLYADDAIATINLADYISELTSYLKESFGQEVPMNIILDVEPVEVGLDIAVPLGLIVNESVSNAYKYAFPRKTDDMAILIRLIFAGDNFEVDIVDNGIGLAKDRPERPGSLGLKLIHGLSREMGATAELFNDPGLHIRLRIPKK